MLYGYGTMQNDGVLVFVCRERAPPRFFPTTRRAVRPTCPFSLPLPLAFPPLLSPPAYPAVVPNDCPPQESATRAPSRVAALLHASVYQRLPPCTVRSVLRVLYRRLCRSVRPYAPRAPRSFFERVSLHVSLSTDHHVSSFFAHSFVTPSRGQRQLPLATASWPICITSAHPKKRAHYLSYLDPRPDRNNQHIDGRRPPPTTNDRSTPPTHTHT